MIYHGKQNQQYSMENRINMLHVDDDPSFTDLTAEFLEREEDRFSIQTATNADEGLEIIADRPPDCIVSDYNMPGMNGIEFLQTVREEHPDLPFILFTGRGSEEVASDAIEAGVTDYIQKDSGSDQYELLANRIENAVQSRREARQANRHKELMRLTEFAGDTGGFEINMDSKEVLLTDGTRRFVGLPDNADLLLEESIEFYHPDDQADVRDTVTRAAETGNQTRGSWRLQALDGNERLVDVTITPSAVNGDATTLRGAINDVTDREERRRELQQLQQAIDDANVPITLADPSEEDDPLVYVNGAFEEMTGYPPEEALGRNCRFLQGEGTDPEEVAMLRSAINNEESTSVELRNYRKDGTEFWNQLTVTPIYGDDGQLVRYLGTQEDITERKTRQQELKAEQEFTRQALDTLTDVFYVLDTDGTIHRWNEQVVEVTGYDPAEIDGMAATEMFPETDQRRIADAIGAVLRDGEATVEADLLAEDGQRVPHEFTGARLTDEDGNVKGVAGVGRDLTERHRREQRFQALVEDSDDIISIVDADGQFQYQSSSLERILDHCPEETVGDTAWEYIHPDDREHVREALEEWITMPETLTSVEYRARDAEGNWRWMEARGNNQLENPAVEGCVINSREITARKEREQELDRTWDLMRNMEQLADIGGWEYDSAAESLMLTDGARRIHGLDPGTDLSLNEAFEAFHPDDRDRLTTRFDECLDAGESYEIDARLTTSDGEQRWITVSGRRVNNDGSGSTVRGHIQDITEEKTRERRLTELNQAAQALLAAESRQEIADIGVEAASGVLDLEANAIHFSEADDAQLVPVAHTDKVTELAGGTTVLPVADSIAGRVYQSGEPEAVEDVREDPDTHDPETDLRSYLYLPLADHGVLIAGDKETAAFDKQDLTLGKLLAGNLVAALDRVGNKQELQDIKDQYQTLVEHFPEGAVFLYDTSLRVVRAGGSELSAVGLSPEGLRGTKPHDRYPSGIADKLVSHLNRALDGVEATFEQEYEGSRYRIRTVPVRTGDEDVGYVMAVSQNITEQAEQRQRLERQNEQLEEFTSIVSHDLQSPLSVARGQLELAEEPTGGEHLEKASAAIERGQALIDDLLTLAHEGQRVAETDAVALVDVAKDSWQTVETAQATLDVGGSAIIEADRSRLKQLLENLYRNAIEHGGEEITVHVTPIEGGFQVSDTGCGIPEAERGEIFEAGYSTSADGTGFGLRIVEEIAEAHGWEIAVSEGEQGGARFEFTQVEFVQE